MIQHRNGFRGENVTMSKVFYFFFNKTEVPKKKNNKSHLTKEREKNHDIVFFSGPQLQLVF